MKKLVLLALSLVLFASHALAAESQTITVNANIPTMTGGLSVAISQVTGSGAGAVWVPDQAAINFGTLNWDPTNHIFLPTSYFAVDVGVTDNSGTPWTITHTRTNLASGVNNLNNKVNVAFVKETDPTGAIAGQQLQKVSLQNSNNVAFTKAQLAGGWLRIYYGVGTGDPANPDAPGVTPIGLDSAAGNYSGTVTITLTP